VHGSWGRISRQLLERHFSKESHHHMSEPRMLREGGPLDPRWVAFFLTFPWMMERQMYVITACAMVLASLSASVAAAARAWSPW
jgi:hypothetical protein